MHAFRSLALILCTLFDIHLICAFCWLKTFVFILHRAHHNMLYFMVNPLNQIQFTIEMNRVVTHWNLTRPRVKIVKTLKCIYILLMEYGILQLNDWNWPSNFHMYHAGYQKCILVLCNICTTLAVRSLHVF